MVDGAGLGAEEAKDTSHRSVVRVACIQFPFPLTGLDPPRQQLRLEAASGLWPCGFGDIPTSMLSLQGTAVPAPSWPILNPGSSRQCWGEGGPRFGGGGCDLQETSFT